jgi:hypothetical protein
LLDDTAAAEAAGAIEPCFSQRVVDGGGKRKEKREERERERERERGERERERKRERRVLGAHTRVASLS